MKRIVDCSFPIVAPVASYTPAFLAALERGGSWAREARLTVALAAQLQWTVDEDRLIYDDVRDVQALTACLYRHIEQPRSGRRALRQLLKYRGLSKYAADSDR